PPCAKAKGCDMAIAPPASSGSGIASDRSNFPLPVSHRQMRSSTPYEAISLPSGLKARATMLAPCHQLVSPSLATAPAGNAASDEPSAAAFLPEALGSTCPTTAPRARKSATAVKQRRERNTRHLRSEWGLEVEA